MAEANLKEFHPIVLLPSYYIQEPKYSQGDELGPLGDLLVDQRLLIKLRDVGCNF